MRKQKPKYIVKESGIPCALISCPEMFGSELVPRRGVLLPTSGIPEIFKGPKSANAAIGRAVRLAKRLRGTMVDGWQKAEKFINRGQFEIVKLPGQTWPP